MSRIIRIESCKDCPNLQHTGMYETPGFAPICRKDRTTRELPFTTVVVNRSMVMAIQTPGIPEWCPLERAQDETKLRAALEAIAAGNTDPDAMVKLAQEALVATDEVRCLGIPRNVEVWRKRMNAAKAATQEG